MRVEPLTVRRLTADLYRHELYPEKWQRGFFQWLLNEEDSYPGSPLASFFLTSIYLFETAIFQSDRVTRRSRFSIPRTSAPTSTEQY